jgi:hypothetical protein
VPKRIEVGFDSVLGRADPSVSFHVLFLSNGKTDHSSQVFIGKANFSRVMKKLENAGDLSGRQNVRV